jgi:hypothetical protein
LLGFVSCYAVFVDGQRGDLTRGNSYRRIERYGDGQVFGTKVFTAKRLVGVGNADGNGFWCAPGATMCADMQGKFEFWQANQLALARVRSDRSNRGLGVHKKPIDVGNDEVIDRK